MKPHDITHIKYTRATDLAGGHRGDVSDRYIIPTTVPQRLIKALDVTDLNEDDRDEMLKWYQLYEEYYRASVSALFDFETWVEHSTGRKVDPKWRTFAEENVEILD